MAYYIRKGLVEENQEFIEQIFQAISNGHEISIPCMSVTQVPKTRNYVNKLLRATRDLTSECNGRYAGLRAQATVSDDLANRAVVIRPKQGDVIPSFTVRKAVNPDEHDALRTLRSTTEHILPLNFTPSPSYEGDEWFIEQSARLGYDIDIQENDPFFIEKGAPPLVYIAKRKTDKPDYLKRLGFGQ